MTRCLVVSTSSPLVSVYISGPRESFGSGLAPRSASQEALKWIERGLAETGLALTDLDGLVADVGPGGFTGVKVGVTLVKTLAWASGKPVAGISAHDLFASGPTALQVKKNQWVCREADGSEQVVDGAFPFGYIGDYSRGEYPSARLTESQFASLRWTKAHLLEPSYGVAPSISQAKNPWVMGTARP